MSNYAIFYHPDTILTSYTFDTTRKGHAIAAQLRAQGITVQTPVPLHTEEALAVHTAEYVHALQTGEPEYLATSQGFDWDTHMWQSVAAQNGAMRDATLAAIQGTPACTTQHRRRFLHIKWACIGGTYSPNPRRTPHPHSRRRCTQRWRYVPHGAPMARDMPCRYCDQPI
jgi:hypothetical protein